jgi:hypothetical protein
MTANWEVQFAEMDRPSFEMYANGGREAGETAGRSYQAWCAGNSGKDPDAFPGVLAAGISSAKEQMLLAGATAEQIEVWSLAFRQALGPYTADNEEAFAFLGL